MTNLISNIQASICSRIADRMLNGLFVIAILILGIVILASCGTQQQSPSPYQTSNHVPAIKGPTGSPRIGQPTSPPP